MRITDKELEPLVGNGDAFELIIHSLIRAESWACQISPSEIDWDYRTNVGDGGRDILIRVGNNNPLRKYIPQKPSIWSLKSGKDGLKPDSLQREILKHTKVLNHLKAGGIYNWCTVAPANNDNDRDSLRQKAEEIAHNIGFDKSQIVFFFRDTITSWLNDYPGLISIYFGIPHSWKSLNEWRDIDRDFSVPWVEFGDRSKLLCEISQHLLASDGTNVLHLAGWSGIGKTRTVLEACLSDPALESVLYFPSIVSFLEIEHYIVRNESTRTSIVIDEVEIGDWDRLSSRLGEYENRIRIITIGPSPKGRFAYREGVVEISLPENIDCVIKVIKSSDPGITQEQATEIAEWSDHDLRLALLLTKANKRDPGLRNQPICSTEDVLNRIFDLFKSELGDINLFRDHMVLLSLCIEIGNIDKYRCELDYLGNFFSRVGTDLDCSIALAQDCGLGKQQGPFFEVAPRALARRIFEIWGWNRVKVQVVSFIRNMPTPRMQKRFVERGHECGSALRKEVSSALAEWFRSQFPSYDLSLIVDRLTSRTFSAYVEMYPEDGLAWLKKAVYNTPGEQLLNFDGEPDGSGGWRGRRQVVWLCEHQACFAEYFRDCEAILYRLALFETEKNIGNNSREIWQGLFLPILSGTSMPFDDRYAILIERLQKADVHEQKLVIKAILAIFNENIARIAPPRTVGGRLVPEEWRPKTNEELYELKIDATHKFIDVIKNLKNDYKKIPICEVISEIDSFLRLGLMKNLQEWLNNEALDEEMLRHLRLNIDKHLYWLRLHLKDKEKGEDITWAQNAVNEIMPWRKQLEPSDLQSRIREVTGRNYWDHERGSSEETTRQLYESLTLELLNNYQTIEDLSEWFISDKALSSREFGFWLGKGDIKELFRDFMTKLISEGNGLDLVSGYLSGLVNRLGKLPLDYSKIFDSFTEKLPSFIIKLSIQCDVSNIGLKRILETLPKAGVNSSVLISSLGWDPWRSIFTLADKARIINLLIELANKNDASACNIGFQLINCWCHAEKEKIEGPLVLPVLTILELSLGKAQRIDAWYWEQAVKLLPDSIVDQKCNLLSLAIVEWKSSQGLWFKDALKLLIDLAKDYPEKVMNSIGKYALDQNYKPAFFLRVYRGLFETIGLDIVKNWVDKYGVDGARVIARHISSPRPLDNDKCYVPPLTEWLLSKFEDDDRVFNEFCAGRHSFETWCGPAKERYKNVEKTMKPYLSHQLRRVREWAEYEIAGAQSLIKWEQKHNAEWERS